MQNEQVANVTCYDADFLPWYCGHQKKDEPEKTLEGCKKAIDDFINNINKATEADMYCGFTTRGKCFRYQVNSEYKSNRKYDNLPKYLNDLKDYIEEKHGFASQEGWESDDLVVSYRKANPQYRVTVVSPDKDVLGSIDVAYNPRKMQWVNNDDEAISYNFWTSMIVGDSIDGIKGIPGKGKVAATEIMKDIKCPPARIIKHYIEHFGEYEGIKQFHTNYLSLKLVDDVPLREIKLNTVNKIMSE